VHANPHANATIRERFNPAQKVERSEASHDRVHVVGDRRTEHREYAITHFPMDNAAVLMHGRPHLLHCWGQPRDRIF
jgi:hypothetical protein